MGREAALGPHERLDFLLLFVERDAVDRLSFGVRALCGGGSRFAIGGNRDGLIALTFPPLLVVKGKCARRRAQSRLHRRRGCCR